jgi:hypothetical protein
MKPGNSGQLIGAVSIGVARDSASANIAAIGAVIAQ